MKKFCCVLVCTLLISMLLSGCANDDNSSISHTISSENQDLIELESSVGSSQNRIMPEDKDVAARGSKAVEAAIPEVAKSGDFVEFNETVEYKIYNGSIIELQVTGAQYLDAAQFSELMLEHTDIAPFTTLRLDDGTGTLKPDAYFLIIDILATAKSGSDHHFGIFSLFKENLDEKFNEPPYPEAYSEQLWFDFEETEQVKRSEIESEYYHFSLPEGSQLQTRIGFCVSGDIKDTEGFYLNVGGGSLELANFIVIRASES